MRPGHDAVTAMMLGSRAARIMGRACTHPNQVAVANEVLTPSESEVAQGQNMMHSVALALGNGDGVALADRGQLIDAANTRKARRVLAPVRCSGIRRTQGAFLVQPER
ncbi:MAG: hypothetical protein CK552_06380 [Actinobacteria bacterium]|nr:MAG: hypothetical protein CK552_06380 [Actinomycetota bacterium]